MKEPKWAQGANLKRASISVLIGSLLWASICTRPIQTSSATNSNASVLEPNSTSSLARRQNLQLISNWLELVAANKRNVSSQGFATGVALEVSPPPVNSLFQYQPANSTSRRVHSRQTPNSRQILVATANRNARTTATADNQQPPDEPVDLFVSNVCERDFMLIKVRTSQPFYGVIHTLNYRWRPQCALEGDGGREFQLNISHVLDSRDAQHCGVIKLTRGSARRQQQPNEQDDGELLSVVLAIRTNRNAELSDDKFLVLNCTNRCRQLDCSSGNSSRLASISQQRPFEGSPVKQRQLERESEAEIRPANSQDQRSWWARAAKRPGQQQLIENKQQAAETCSVWRFPWLLALIVCLAILLTGCAVSNCIICRLRSAPSRVSIESQSDLGGTRPKQEVVKQHTIYYGNERRQQRPSPLDVGPDPGRRPRHRHERPPDRRSR